MDNKTSDNINGYFSILAVVMILYGLYAIFIQSDIFIGLFFSIYGIICLYIFLKKPNEAE